METGNTLYAGSMETGQARENLSASLSLGRRRSRGLSYLLPAPCSPLQPSAAPASTEGGRCGRQRQLEHLTIPL